jgi:putative copper resistance protein D
MGGSIVDELSATLRALSFIAQLQAAGIAIFVVLFGRLLPSTARGTRRIGVFSGVFGILFVAAHYALEAARMGGELAGIVDPMLQGLVLHSAMSAALTVRIAGLVLIVMGLRAESRASIPVSLAGVLILVSAFTLVGHTSTDEHRWLLAVLLMVHLSIVSFWFGALIPLYRASLSETSAMAGELTDAFSRLAVWLVPVILIAGVLLAVTLLPSLEALRTTYGELLLAKLVLFAVLMLFAALNKWRLGPGLTRGDARVGAHFRRSLATEYLLIVATLSVTAIMTAFFSPH